MPKACLYSSSKFAVEGMMQSISKELPSPLSILTYDPGTVATAMFARMFKLKKTGKDLENEGMMGPKEWSKKSVPHLLSLGRKDNGKAMETIVASQTYQRSAKLLAT